MPTLVSRASESSWYELAGQCDEPGLSRVSRSLPIALRSGACCCVVMVVVSAVAHLSNSP